MELANDQFWMFAERCGLQLITLLVNNEFPRKNVMPMKSMKNIFIREVKFRIAS
jgi:hypothetical protein